MNDLFVSIFEMSLGACFPVVAVFLLRAIISRKVPKWTMCLLWLLVGIKLLIPISFETELSLEPMEYIDSVVENSDVEYEFSYPVIPDDLVENGQENTAQNQNGITQSMIPKIWLGGVMLMLAYGLVGFAATKKRVSLFIEDEDGIRTCENISSPFVFGVFKPEIYLPMGIDENSKKYIIAHENAHIKRLDHITKMVAFLILAFHWFNPLVWVAFVALSRDIEYACDERVLNSLDNEGKKQYAYALLESTVKKTKAFSLTVPFGEIGAKKRIKNVFSRKFKNKASFVVISFLVVLFCLCFFTEKPVEIVSPAETVSGDTTHSDLNVDVEFLEKYIKDSIMSAVNYQPQNSKDENALEDLMDKVGEYWESGFNSDDSDKINTSTSGQFVDNGKATAEQNEKDKALQAEMDAKYKQQYGFSTPTVNIPTVNRPTVNLPTIKWDVY